MKNISKTGIALVMALGFAALTACSDDDNNSYPYPVTDVTAQVDAEFAEALQAHGYITDANRITDSTLRHIKALDLSGNPLSADSKLTSLKGIEYFTELQELKVKSNALTELDLSRNGELVTLECQNNRLTRLILPVADDDLRYVNCGHNELTSLDVTGHDDIMHLDVSHNRLTVLDIRGLDDLNALHVNYNLLTSIDISGARLLRSFGCEGNPGTGGVFSVKAWFTDSNVPANFTTGTWTYNDATVRVTYIR